MFHRAHRLSEPTCFIKRNMMFHDVSPAMKHACFTSYETCFSIKSFKNNHLTCSSFYFSKGLRPCRASLGIPSRCAPKMPALRAVVFMACSGPAALAQVGFAPLEPPLLPPRARGAGGRAPPAPTHGGWGRSSRVKGPSPRPCGAAGRTNPLTRLPLENAPQGHCRAPEWKGVKVRAATAQRPRP